MNKILERGERKEEREERNVWYERGNDYRRRGDWQNALNCYMEAIAIDPQSPAVEAKQMLEDILNFYHKDAYNP